MQWSYRLLPLCMIRLQSRLIWKKEYSLFIKGGWSEFSFGAETVLSVLRWNSRSIDANIDKYRYDYYLLITLAIIRYFLRFKRVAPCSAISAGSPRFMENGDAQDIWAFEKFRLHSSCMFSKITNLRR